MMNAFLRETRKLISNHISERFCIILGNESCDLDSAVSSLSLAYYYNKNKKSLPTNSKADHVVPLFNINREELPLKTEVIHYFKKHNIDSDSITFKDDISESFITSNDVVLVDHHFSKYSPIAVFDHRPFDPNSTLSKDCQVQLETVGSCATLIGELILNNVNTDEYQDILKHLYAAIVLDTINFSKEAERAKEKDFQIADRIESFLNLTNIDEHRKELFDDLVKARADISTLSSYQLLLKDMKLISSKIDDTIKVSLPGFPMLVHEFVRLKDAEDSLKKFANVYRCHVIVLIGMKVTEDGLKRDVGVINISNDALYNVIVEKLTSGSFELEEYNDCTLLNGKFFAQKNIRASRKQILPLVKTVLDEFI